MDRTFCQRVQGTARGALHRNQKALVDFDDGPEPPISSGPRSASYYVVLFIPSSLSFIAQRILGKLHSEIRYTC
jgi:hypothetical protein